MITLFEKKVTDALKSYQPYKKITRNIGQKIYPFFIEGLKGSFTAFLMAKMRPLLPGPVLIVVPHEREAEYLYQDLSLFTDEVSLFPWWNNLPYSGTRVDSNIAGDRICRLIELIRSNRTIMVTSLRSFLTPLPPRSSIEESLLTLSCGDEFDPVTLSRTLLSYGYTRVPSVSVIGEYALRGEVLDIFLPGVQNAVRIVFEFDTIEEIKHFDTMSQHSTDKLDSITLYPAKEIVWSDERTKGLQEQLRAVKNDPAIVEKVVAEIQERGECPNEEYLFPFSFENSGSLLDYIPQNSVIMLSEYEQLLRGNETLQKEFQELARKGRREENLIIPHRRLLHDFEELIETKERKIIFPIIQEGGREKENGERTVHVQCDGPKSFFGNIDYLREEIDNLKQSEYDIFVFTDSDTQRQRIEHLLKDMDVHVVTEQISSGFTCPDMKIAAIHENEIFGRKRRIPKSVKQAKSQPIDTFVELNEGDYVVHINHGIGKFTGIERIQAAGTERDYIRLQYANEETIFIPIEQVNMIQRYIGSEGSSPRLDKIGGKSWEKRKHKVKKSVEDLAERLIKLYSKRKMAKGFAFSEDTDWQIQFEASFPYEETEDQLRCIEEVKQDMESEQPMDRLICGDVGYGKTEVAMRAAFKAVMGGKQVAFLAPTTILAEQHYENFCERFQGFPVNISMLSRFITRAEQKKILRKLHRGEIDILIGTHRILQRDVHYKNMGLLVVDEEQRFGVKAKERLKELKHSVDCLTLTATPIPRTLHMSLLKIRDMSLLTTPPRNRLAIKTFIQEFDEEVIANAIRSEIERGGQVYFLHNRIETLDNVKLFLQRLVPEMIIELAHGQMGSEDLEDIMHRFIHNGIQVLVSTTIIENGIDIPNVNTIIIDRADMYGISQLYQLRGRVGRADKRAYAYLLYPEQKAMSEIAMKRLQIISDYTDLGSGFKIALKDLEVRGAGNLLGRQQHGDILSVGFDMYIRLLDEAIAELSENGGEEQPPEVYLELDYSGYIPDSYISEPTEKMEIYKQIASITSEEELHKVQLDLEDRFGPLPDQVSSLLSLAEIRIIAKSLFISSIKERKGTLEVEFAKVSKISPDKVMRLIQDSGGNVRLDPHRPNILLMKTDVIGLAEKSEFIRDKLSLLA
jgi:transcription-repair coupling factor (superfamily II helicase)